MAVGSQLGKLQATEGHPGCCLVPGVTEAHCGRKARNEGVLAGSAAEGGGRKLTRRGETSGAACLIGTHAASFKSQKTAEKPVHRRRKLGVE